MSAVLVQAGHDILVFPADATDDVRCVGENSFGNRCRDSVLGGDYGWDSCVIPGRGEVEIIRHAVDRDHQLRSQLCAFHLRTPTPPYCAPTWQLLDLDVHRDLVTDYRLAWVNGTVIARPLPPLIVIEQGDDEAVTNVEPVEDPRVTALYRWFDTDDLLLYVGLTGDLASRSRRHATYSSWSEFAVRCTVERFATRTETETAERVAIETEKPLFNWQHADQDEARPRLVRYLIRHDRTDLLMPAISRG